MTDTKKQKIFFMVAFFTIMLPQTLLAYVFVMKPEWVTQVEMNLSVQLGIPQALRGVYRLLALIQALNCYAYAEKTELKAFWKWIMLVMIFLVPPTQWVVVIALLIQDPKVLSKPLAENLDTNIREING